MHAEHLEYMPGKDTDVELYLFFNRLSVFFSDMSVVWQVDRQDILFKKIYGKSTRYSMHRDSLRKVCSILALFLKAEHRCSYPDLKLCDH